MIKFSGVARYACSSTLWLALVALTSDMRHRWKVRLILGQIHLIEPLIVEGLVILDIFILP
jgi:hypothetical protein